MADDKPEPGTVRVWFTMTNTYLQHLTLDTLASEGAPVDDVDALADWLEGACGVDYLTENAREWDCDFTSALVTDVEGLE